MGSPEISTIKIQLLAKNMVSEKVWEREELIPIKSLGASGSPTIVKVALSLDVGVSGSGEKKNVIYNLSGPSGVDQSLCCFC